MISTGDVKKGVIIELDGQLMKVLDWTHIKMARGSAQVRMKLQNVRKGDIVERTFQAGTRWPRARVEQRKAQYLYSDGDDLIFMDNETFDQMPLGKGCDTFCPMGPVLVTADEIGDPATLHVASYVNGELRQSAPTAQMLFDVSTLVAHASRHITLEPGDVITTGTPAGCGTFRNPPLWLRPGDVVEVEVDRIGRLRNPVIAGW